MDFQRVVHLGTVKANLRWASVFCKIEYEKGRLSITGVVGPLRSGNALGGCGQIEDEIRDAEFNRFAPGWDHALVKRFVEAWDRWHLNDMRAGCSHQRAAGWGRTKLAIATWILDSETSDRQRKIQQEVMAAVRRGEVRPVTGLERGILNLPYNIKCADGASPAGEYTCYYKKSGVEEKFDGCVRPSEHPEGKLCRPCAECGYEYGSKWLREDVPTDVLDFLRALPETDVTPAWV